MKHKTIICVTELVDTKTSIKWLRGKWKVLIIMSLRKGPIRFNKLKLITNCNSNSLSKNLKQLEKHGIVIKTTNPHIKYGLTIVGMKIAKLIAELENVLNELPH